MKNINKSPVKGNEKFILGHYIIDMSAYSTKISKTFFIFPLNCIILASFQWNSLDILFEIDGNHEKRNKFSIQKLNWKEKKGELAIFFKAV